MPLKLITSSGEKLKISRSGEQVCFFHMNQSPKIIPEDAEKNLRLVNYASF